MSIPDCNFSIFSLMDTLSFLHKRKMKELEGQDRNDYLLMNARLIFAHYGERNQFNKYYRQYLYNINPNLNVLKNKLNEYLLLTELEGRTVSYGPSFFPPRFMAQARSARAINRRGKNEDP